MATKNVPVVSYKGFNENLQCRDFQYEIGKTYTHKGKVEACESGFHACEYPLDVFRYYTPSDCGKMNRFCVVEQSGTLSRHEDDSKIASHKIKVGLEIGLPGLIKAAIDYTFKRVAPVDKNSPAWNENERGAASNSGYGGAAFSIGKWSKVKSGKDGAICIVTNNDDGSIRHIKSSKVGENGIKPDVWYSLNDDGDFIEAN
jgi:hypothetical protein